MRKMANLLLAAAALSLASLGVASPALAAVPDNSARAAGDASAVRPADDGNHHGCPPWMFPHCNDLSFDVDMDVPGYNWHIDLANRCKNLGFNTHEILKSVNYTGSNGHRWAHGAYRCYNS